MEDTQTIKGKVLDRFLTCPNCGAGLSASVVEEYEVPAQLCSLDLKKIEGGKFVVENFDYRAPKDSNPAEWAYKASDSGYLRLSCPKCAFETTPLYCDEVEDEYDLNILEVALDERSEV